jgi:hypothetical protein
LNAADSCMRSFLEGGHIAQSNKHRCTSPSSLFAKRITFVCFFASTNGQMKNFHLHNEQMVNGLREIA